MKTIFVDAVHTFVSKEGVVDDKMYELLESYPNPKVVLTNADDEQIEKYKLAGLPYEVYTLCHEPDKVDPIYFFAALSQYDLDADQAIYFEHNKDAVASAASVGIVSYHFDHQTRDLEALKTFIDNHL